MITYLIYKAGRGFYRPECKGYTSERSQAGRYTHERAVKEALIDPRIIKAIAIDEDPEFTAVALRQLVLDLQAMVSRHNAGLTPLGHAVTDLTEQAWKRDQA